MTDKQENKLSMDRATETVLNDNNSKWSADALFTTVKTMLSGKIADLLNARQRQSNIDTGIAVDKQVLKNMLIAKAGSVASKVAMFAEDTNNNELLNEVNLSHSQLDKARDEVVGGLCQNIHDHANDNIAALAAYGLSAGILANLQTAVDVYEVKVPQPRAAKAAKKAVTIQIVTLLKDTDKILKNRLDKLMEDYKVGEPEFYNAYKAARIIIDLGATHTKLRLLVKDQAGAGIQGVTVSLIQNNLVAYHADTNSEGLLRLSKIKPGTFDLRLEKLNFVTQTKPGIVFKAGKEVKRTITLVPGVSTIPGGTAIREADVPMGSIANVDITDIHGTASTTATFEAAGSIFRVYAAVNPADLPGAQFFDVQPGTPVTKTSAELILQLGMDNIKKYLMVQNIGASTGHYKITFTNLEP